MATGAPLPVREFSDYREMQAHAAAVRARMFPPVQSVVVIPESRRPQVCTPNPVRITPDAISEMKALRAAGQSMTWIAAKLNVSRKSVSRHTSVVPPPEGGWTRGGHASRYPVETINRMYGAGSTVTEIAKALNAPRTSICDLLDPNAKRPRRKRVVSPEPVKVPRSDLLTLEVIAETRERRAEGQSLRIIADALKVSQRSVYNYTRDVPPPDGKWPDGRHKSRHPIVKMQRMLRAGFSYREIGEEIGVRKGMVWNLLNPRPRLNRGRARNGQRVG